jgi:hypothetical protein
VDCVALPGPELVVLPKPVLVCEAFPPVQLLATHTGAFAFTGALAAAAASTTALPT